MRNVNTLNGARRAPDSGSNPNANASFMETWNSFPPVSRTIVLLMALVTSSCALQLVSPARVVFHFYEITRYWQWWRLWTSFFLLPLNAMSALMQLYNMGSRAVYLETDRFLVSRHFSASIDFAFYLCFCFVSIICGAVLVYGQYQPLVLTTAFDACLTLTWAIDNAHTEVRFYGIIPLHGKYYPLFQGLVTLVFGGDIVLLALGFLAAYVFNCLDTATWGPLWGLVARRDQWYGVVPVGHFHAPRWFIIVYEFLFGGNYSTLAQEARQLKQRKLGQRLGSAPHSSSSSNAGQRLGGLETLGANQTIPRRDYLATGSRSNLTSATRKSN